jgi:hypothetical protein
MIPTIIYLLLRRYRRSNPEKAERVAIMLQKTTRLLLFLILLLLISHFALPQSTKLEYSITRKGNNIGTMSFSRHLSGNKTIFKIESNVKARLIFVITVKALEEAIYENGIMTWSFLYRKMNGTEKVNKKTTLLGNNYVIIKGHHSETLNTYPIRYNMICLYLNEPTDIPKVYSDNFQQFLDIETLGDHHYKISFPDGNFNEYYYTNGLCSKVEVNHRFYSSTIELKTK